MRKDPQAVDLPCGANAEEVRAYTQLFEALEGELRALARQQMSTQPLGHTLQPTALVNEVYLRLLNSEGVNLNGRTHFMRLASQVMRQILVDHARKRGASKRQSGGRRVEFDELVDELDRRSGGGLVALDGALVRLQERNPVLVRLVEMRFFGGRTMKEISEVLGVSERQALRYWNSARAFLRTHVNGTQA